MTQKLTNSYGDHSKNSAARFDLDPFYKLGPTFWPNQAETCLGTMAPRSPSGATTLVAPPGALLPTHMGSHVYQPVLKLFHTICTKKLSNSLFNFNLKDFFFGFIWIL